MEKEKVKLTFLGTGTSQGVPMIGCDCEVCKSTDRHDKRLRASALVETCGMKIQIDAGPDFRYQMLRAGVRDVDAILMTHNHKDHTAGLDDVRAFNWFSGGQPTRIYCEANVLEPLTREYAYVFAENKYPGAPSWDVHLIDERPFSISPRSVSEGLSDADKAVLMKNGYIADTVTEEENVRTKKKVDVIPIRGMHYKLPVLGFRFGDIAYCTDMNYIPEEEFEKLRGLDHFVINTVRREHHISHFSLEEAVEVCRRVGARHSWLTHLSHQLPCHEALSAELAEQLHADLPLDIRPAYDGLVITSGY